MKHVAWMIGCLAMIGGAYAQTPAVPKSAAAATPATEPKIAYPDWLFPVDDETLRAAKRPPDSTKPAS